MAIFSGPTGLNSLRDVRGSIVVQAVLGQDEKNHHKPVVLSVGDRVLTEAQGGCC